MKNFLSFLFSLDPPTSPVGCNVTETGTFKLRVKCTGRAGQGSRSSPELSYVRSPEARTTTMLEVNMKKTLSIVIGGLHGLPNQN